MTYYSVARYENLFITTIFICNLFDILEVVYIYFVIKFLSEWTISDGYDIFLSKFAKKFVALKL